MFQHGYSRSKHIKPAMRRRKYQGHHLLIYILLAIFTLVCVLSDQLYRNAKQGSMLTSTTEYTRSQWSSIQVIVTAKCFFFLSFPWYFLLLCDNFATSFVCIYRGTDRLLCTSTSHQSIERKKVVGPTSSMSFYFMCLIVVNTITSIIDMYNIEISQVPSTHCTPILFFNKKKKKNV